MTDDSMTASTNLPVRGDARRSWRELIAPYTAADPRRGLIQLLNTGLPFLALVAAMLAGTDHGFWAVLVLIAPGAALLVRLFMIQHDCGHGSFFKSRWANDLLGRALGVLTLTPYDFWRAAHAVHHATTGNLDRRGVGDISTLTVREYLSLPRWRRIGYRIYRHPLVLFGIGPAYQFLLRHRIPTGHPLRQWRNWLSILGTNAALAAVVVAVALTIGLRPFLLSYVPVCMLAASTGVWLFYVQHQFEGTYWAPTQQWNFHAAAMEGSSFYDLPRFLHWVTGYIGFHHIHHLSSRIPNYRLRECFKENPEMRQVTRISLWDSLRCPRLALWDETARKLVSFGHLRRHSSAPRRAP
jgi:omega-6 fatty acid desaturase (delta-12 desaturase)